MLGGSRVSNYHQLNAMKRIFYPHLKPYLSYKSLRLRGYDYSRTGAYFVTMCTQNRANLFGKIVKNEMRLNVYGRMGQEVWNGLFGHYPHVVLDAFVIMPNHIHGIVVLSVGAGFKPAPTRHGLPEIVRAFKTFSARQINESRHTPGTPVWQRNYYEHIIRNQAALNRIRQYIIDNPGHWEKDRENPTRKSHHRKMT